MQTLLLCPSLLGDGVPCQQTTTSAADLPLGPQNPVLSFSPPSQPTSNRGHRPHTDLTSNPSDRDYSDPTGPQHVHAQTACDPETSVPYTTHLHACTHTMPMTIPWHSAPHPGNTGKTLISAGGLGQRGLSGLSSSSPSPLQCPCLPLTAS